MATNEDLPKVAYCWTWNYRRNRIGTPLTESEASSRDAEGDEYTAVLSTHPGLSHPILVTICWKNAYASTQFLDDHGRPHVQYEFAKVSDKQLFLKRVFIWEYPDDNPRLTVKDSKVYEEFDYREDGYLKHTKFNEYENVKDIAEYKETSVEANWEPVPEFGEYGSIARWERST
ncbi:hypothetical protein GCM10023224_05850 [Streptomonospora halophila]|uniref:Uncharacterized protein n=1 Tax=Streptomonospora halophila TaxID=427369 RepID=A0ABP9G640_9ACTN